MHHHGHHVLEAPHEHVGHASCALGSVAGTGRPPIMGMDMTIWSAVISWPSKLHGNAFQGLPDCMSLF